MPVGNPFESAANLFERQNYSTDPVTWAKERAGVQLWSKQRDIAYSVLAHKRTAVQSAHGVGKSFLAATLAAWWVDTHSPKDTMVVTTAPSVEQVHGVLWEEIRGLHQSAGLPGVVQRTDKWIVGGRQVGVGRKPPDHNEVAFQGYHRKYVLVILDEACGIPEWLWTAVETITTGPHCRILAIGNPDDPSSHFRKVCTEVKGWVSHKISVFDSPNFTGEAGPPIWRDVLTDPSWESERKSEWGVTNPLYVAKCLGQFPTDSPWGVIRLTDLYACRIADMPRAAHELTPVALGVDVGGGTDETVVRERRGMVAGREWTERTDKPENVARLVLRAVKVTGATQINVDSIGIGHGVVGELRNMKQLGFHQANVFGVNVSERATEPDKYFNLRSQLWWEVGRVAAEQRAMDLSKGDNMDKTMAQLCEPQYSFDLKGRIKIESKDDLRKRLNRSPDNADALLLAFFAARSSATEWFQTIMGRA